MHRYIFIIPTILATVVEFYRTELLLAGVPESQFVIIPRTLYVLGFVLLIVMNVDLFKHKKK